MSFNYGRIETTIVIKLIGNNNKLYTYYTQKNNQDLNYN